MKILATFAHFFDSGGDGFYGSTSANAEPRVTALRAAIAALHQHFGPNQAKLRQTGNTVLEPVNAGKTGDVTVVIATTGGNHLVEQLDLPARFYEHVPTAAEPMQLAFECQKILRDRLGAYDHYCYLEDDLVIQDADFFAKLSWFNSMTPADAVLLPNRFELAVGEAHDKLYIDGHVSADLTRRWQDFGERRQIRGRFMGREIVFQKTYNPHAGCYFLNEDQMRAWSAAPHFLDYDTAFAGPLESAATLGIMKTFALYKPAADNANFLEILHANNRYLGQDLKFRR